MQSDTYTTEKPWTQEYSPSMTSEDHMLAPTHPLVGRLAVQHSFNPLTAKEKLYAHHMARAAWHGTRIILRQVSPESIPIYEFILELYYSCEGRWQELAARTDVSVHYVYEFLEYAAVFLGNIGNYYGRGDQKFIPRIPKAYLKRLAKGSARATVLYDAIVEPMFARRPSSLGYPSEVAQSSYYPGDLPMSRVEIDRVSRILEKHSIHPENTRIQKIWQNDRFIFQVFQASVETDNKPCEISSSEGTVRIVRGDHSNELEHICECLEAAVKFVANPLQGDVIRQYQKSFRTGDMEAFKESQRLWVKDIGPSIETQFGFVEPYRDPYGTRAEFEGLVAFVDAEETKILSNLVDNSAKYIRQLPWAVNCTDNDGKGPFEKDLFEPPDFTSLQTLAYCSSIIFAGINLPNFNDIRQEVGFKNFMISNQFAAKYGIKRIDPAFVDPSEATAFLTAEYDTSYIWVVVHELLGHGTGKLLAQKGPDQFNFDIHNLPLNPLDSKPINSWYLPGESWTGVFGDIATSVDECRAECVGAYLMDDEGLLKLFGFEETKMSAADITYNLYLQLGTGGLRALENYIEDDHKWGQAHSRAHFAMFRCLLAAGDDFMTIKHDAPSNKLTVYLDRSKILSHGKPAIGELLLRLHVYRCIADITACREYYEELTKVEGVFAEYRQIVIANKRPRQVLVQANTVLEADGQVSLREYEASVDGMIQSWAERGV